MQLLLLFKPNVMKEKYFFSNVDNEKGSLLHVFATRYGAL